MYHHGRDRNRPAAAATALLEKSASVKTAIAMQKLNLDRSTAEAKLATHKKSRPLAE